VEQLLLAGRLERVPPDHAAALSMLEEARRHLRSAGLILAADPNGAMRCSTTGDAAGAGVVVGDAVAAGEGVAATVGGRVVAEAQITKSVISAR
jgi:hypothetical protein